MTDIAKKLRELADEVDTDKELYVSLDDDGDIIFCTDTDEDADNCDIDGWIGMNFVEEIDGEVIENDVWKKVKVTLSVAE
jgi:hypothetical protein